MDNQTADFLGDKTRRDELIKGLTGKVAPEEMLQALSTNQLEIAGKKLQRVTKEVMDAVERNRTGECSRFLNPEIQDIDLLEEFWTEWAKIGRLMMDKIKDKAQRQTRVESPSRNAP